MIVGLIQKKIKIIIKMIISEKNQIQISIIIMHGIKRINLIIITTITIEIIIVRKITIISNKEKIISLNYIIKTLIIKIVTIKINLLILMNCIIIQMIIIIMMIHMG